MSSLKTAVVALVMLFALGAGTAQATHWGHRHYAGYGGWWYGYHGGGPWAGIYYGGVSPYYAPYGYYSGWAVAPHYHVGYYGTGYYGGGYYGGGYYGGGGCCGW